ncbi:probable serine/threonine-protein kinase kinX [Impatiens glandulifera]|uniref:probable serine/threonine-protein kinase kinX n=1 Tax=Impatiens glandulifera TaxID=253017 RepID=UPI001FB08B11|nr:probable serine/threonine-protein kinase kinX [Impatiens glandulifera]
MEKMKKKKSKVGKKKEKNEVKDPKVEQNVEESKVEQNVEESKVDQNVEGTDVKVEEFEEEDQNVKENEAKDPNDVKVEEFEEEDQNVEENEVNDPKVVKVKEESKVEENVEETEVVEQKEESKIVVEQKESNVVVEKKDETKESSTVDDDEKMDDVDDLKLKVEDLKVKDVKVQKGIESKKVEDDNDDLQLYNTPPKANFRRRVRKPKKDESYTNPSLSKLPKTNDPMKINPLQKFEDELLDKVKDWLDDPKTNDATKDVSTCVVGKDMFVRVLTRLTWLEETEIDAFCYLLRKRIAEYPKTKVAIGDCLLADRIGREYKKFSNDIANYPVDEFKDYYMGAPHRNMLEWSEIDDIYLPVNINQKHWILCVARLQKYRIERL